MYTLNKNKEKLSRRRTVVYLPDFGVVVEVEDVDLLGRPIV